MTYAHAPGCRQYSFPCTHQDIMHENDLRDREWPIRPTDTELTKSAWRSAKKRADLVCLSALLLRDAGARQVSLVKKIGGGGRKFSRARGTGLEFHFVRFCDVIYVTCQHWCHIWLLLYTRTISLLRASWADTTYSRK